MVIILLNNYLVSHPIICWAALNFANASLYLKSFRLTINSVFFPLSNLSFNFFYKCTQVIVFCPQCTPCKESVLLSFLLTLWG